MLAQMHRGLDIAAGPRVVAGIRRRLCPRNRLGTVVGQAVGQCSGGVLGWQRPVVDELGQSSLYVVAGPRCVFDRASQPGPLRVVAESRIERLDDGTPSVGG